MIRIQHLKQPKETSGTKVEAGKSFAMKGIEIKNKNKFPVYVDFYQRKKAAAKTEKRAK